MKKKLKTDKQIDLFPPVSGWETPQLPDIPADIPVAVDIETRDPGLAQDLGSSWAWGDGHICGVSVAWADQAIYVPMAHPDTLCLPVGNVVAWLRHVMAHASAVIFFNAGYDLGWFSTVGLSPPENLHDTHAMAVMLDENRFSYSMDDICKAYHVRGKDEKALRDAAAALGYDAKNELWRLPARFVADYAMQDARATLSLYEMLTPKIVEEELIPAYQLEMALVPMIIKMRARGIRVDLDKAAQTQKALQQEEYKILQQIKEVANLPNVPQIGELFSPLALSQMFDELGLQYGKTPKSKLPQFKKEWLREHAHPFPRLISRARQLHDLSSKFIGRYILQNQWKGRIFAEIHQLRDERGGTRSYRFSYSNPPLQQMPAKGDKIFSKMIRDIFLPEKGEQWFAPDYSQQEPRLAVHYAHVCKLASAQAAIDYYNNHPNPDFHTMVSEMTGIPRDPAKIINLGMMYGMGRKKLADSLHLTLEEADEILDNYHKKLPFVRELSDLCKRRAEGRGYIRLLDGARCRFDMWQPASRLRNEAVLPKPLPRAAAFKQWRDRALVRAFTHKTMNRVVQGGAARQTKMAMRDCYQAGFLPCIQMHDEIGFSISNPVDGYKITDLMINCVKLAVPVKVDPEYGESWGSAKNNLSLWNIKN